MNNITYILNYCYGLLQIRLNFTPFSFTVWQAMIALFLLGIAVDFFVDVFNK